jgi:DNA helicase HerA-like ATPase
MFLIRSHRHRGHYLYLTTQYLGDFPPAVLQCLTHVHIFRSTAPATIDRLAATFPRLDLAAIQSLPDRQKLEFSPRVPPAAPEKA